MRARHLQGTYCGADFLWSNRTQGAGPLTTRTQCPLRHNCPRLHSSRGGACCNRFASRCRGGLYEPQAAAEAPAVRTPSEAPSTSDQSRQSGRFGSAGANNKAAVAPIAVSASLWQPSSVNPLRAEAAEAVQGLHANEYNHAGDNGCHPVGMVQRSAAANGLSAEPDVQVSSQTDDNQRLRSSRGQPVAMPSSNLPPGQSMGSNPPPIELDGEGRTPYTVKTSHSSALSPIGAASQLGRNSVADQLSNGVDTGLTTDRLHATAATDGLVLPDNAAELGVASGIETLVANALEFDEGAFQGRIWGDVDWELEGLRPIDDTAVSIPSSSSSRRGDVGAALCTSRNGAGTGRRRNRRPDGGGNRLDDEEGTWDFDSFGYGDISDDNINAAAIDPGTTWSRNREDNDVGSPGQLRPQQRGRGDRGRRGRNIGRRWQGEWEENDEFDDGGRQGDVSQGWVQGKEHDGGLDVGRWEVTNFGAFRNPNEDRAAPSGAIDDVVGDIGCGVLGAGGRRAAIAAESKLRRAVAAASTRLPRRGLSVSFPLPPASCAAPAVTPTPAMTSAPAPAPAAHAAPMPTPPAVSDGQSESAAHQEASMPLSPDASVQPSGTAAAAPTTSSAPSASSGSSHDWATVPLSYNFGPSFKLLEQTAEPREVPLPKDLLALAGRLSDGGGGRSAIDALLPGCTAYTAADDYTVLLVQDARSMKPAVAWLRASIGHDGVVGIDAEWPPVFKSGSPPQLALLQVASPSRVLLLHVAQMKRQALAAGGPIHTLLSDASLTWVGCGWSNSDRHVITKAFGGATLPAAVVDVQVAAKVAGWPRVGLLGLVNDMLGVKEFQKPRKLSMCNWAEASMSTRKIRYAALDALLPPVLLRQLRLFAAMPALRCSFCKQPMHAQREFDPIQPVPRVRKGISPVVCDHCGRVVRRASADGGSCHDPVNPVAGAQAEGTSPETTNIASGSPPIPKAASKAGSLRTYLQNVVNGRQKTQGPEGRRSRQSLFSDGSDPGSDSGPGSDLDLASDGEAEPSNTSGAIGEVGAGAGKGKSKRKRKRTVRSAAGNGGASQSSSRQQAMWEAFEEASPAAAAAVTLAMAGQGSNDKGAS